MTAQTRTVNKTRFEQGDKPQGTDYVDLIDSYMSLADTTAQSLSSPLSITGALGVSTEVSAVSVEASAAVFRTTLTSALTVSGDATIFGNLDVKGTIDFPGRSEGEIFIEATALVSASATFVELLSVATAFSTFLTDFQVSAGSLVYTGATAKTFLCLANVGAAASQNNTDTHIRIAIEGSSLARTELGKVIGTSEDQLYLHSTLLLNQNERVSLQIQSDAAAAVGFTIAKTILTVRE